MATAVILRRAPISSGPSKSSWHVSTTKISTVSKPSICIPAPRTRPEAARSWLSPCSGRPACLHRAPPLPRSLSPCPASTTRNMLGLYAVVENVDRAFLKDRFGERGGTAAEAVPGSQRRTSSATTGNKYKEQYRPQSEPTPKQDRTRHRISPSSSTRPRTTRFKKEIGSYLDVDGFLRFLAANALASNLEGAFALGTTITCISIRKPTSSFSSPAISNSPWPTHPVHGDGGPAHGPEPDAPLSGRQQTGRIGCSPSRK